MKAPVNIPNEIDGIPVYEMVPDLGREGEGFTVVSFVETPANKKAFIALSEELPEERVNKLLFDTVKLSISPEKREVTGVVMRANFPILRIHPETNKPYYFYMTPEMIEEAVDVFMEKKLTDAVTVDHNGEKVDGVFLKNTFFMSPEHRAGYQEFDDVEDGSWMATYKVKNDDVWDSIIKGKIQGYSPEITGSLKEIPRDQQVAQLSALAQMSKIVNIINRI